MAKITIGHLEEGKVQQTNQSRLNKQEQDDLLYCPSNLKTKYYGFSFTFSELLELIVLIFVWYLTSSFSNNINKSILDVFSFPLTLTMLNFGFICIFCFLMMLGTNYSRLQKLDLKTIARIIIPLCISQIVAHLLTQLSLQHVPVSFTHTVKACSPIFAILFSLYYKFDEKYSPLLLCSILPIICGIVLSSATEINFKFLGFITALGSTIVFTWQNAFSKKVFRGGDMDHMNLLFYTAFFAFLFIFPIWVVVDLPNLFLDGGYEGRGWNLISMCLLNGVCHFGQNITAFTFMTNVTPLTYTVFNTFKRVFVIVSSILYFGNSILPLNAVGIGLAVLGVAFYNKAKFDLTKK